MILTLNFRSVKLLWKEVSHLDSILSKPIRPGGKLLRFGGKLRAFDDFQGECTSF